MTTLGDKAPDFSGLDQDGNAHKLADYKGKKLVVFIQKQVLRLHGRSL
jgi:peroxiredoxin Q/BCP